MLEKVRKCMSTVMQLDEPRSAAIDQQTTAADVPEWTSVVHLSLVLELEKAFGVQFSNDEIVALGSVDAILKHLAAKGANG